MRETITEGGGRETCKAALCAEICETMGFEPSNVAFAPAFTPTARAELERLCSGVCGACPILEAAEAMQAIRLAGDRRRRSARPDPSAPIRLRPRLRRAQ